MTHIGIIFRKIRKDLGLKQIEVAQSAGLHRAYLNRIEAGIIVHPRLDTLNKIATALGAPLPEIIASWGQANAGKLAGELYYN